MRRRYSLVAMCVSGGVLLGGCGVRQADGLPSVTWGEVACAECHMLISEERFAVSLVLASGETEFLDSVDCLARRLHREPAVFRRVWVHDYEGSPWIDGHDAAYVQSPELRTPMGLGIVAVGDAQRAEALADRVHGRVLRFDELRAVGA